MPLVVEISVAFSILIAFIVIGIFLFRSASARFGGCPALDASGANDEPASLRSRHGRPADPDLLGGAAGRLAQPRLAARLNVVAVATFLSALSLFVFERPSPGRMC